MISIRMDSGNTLRLLVAKYFALSVGRYRFQDRLPGWLNKGSQKTTFLHRKPPSFSFLKIQTGRSKV